jgi:hypothetical protein
LDTGSTKVRTHLTTNRWVDRRRSMRRNPLVRRLERIFALRLLLALATALLLLALVNRWEQCRQNSMDPRCWLHDAGGVVSVANLEALSIVTASVLFVLEAGRRRQRDHIDAMELILNCRQAGVRFSFARNDAIERLAAAGIWLDGQDFSGLVLDEIALPGARLQGVNLAGASLRDANLFQCDLQGANLRDADLCGADLRGANLEQADLGGAQLQGARLEGARLQGAKPQLV